MAQFLSLSFAPRLWALLRLMLPLSPHSLCASPSSSTSPSFPSSGWCFRSCGGRGIGCPRKKPSSSESEDEEHVEQESSCLYWPGWSVSAEELAEPRPSLSFSPLHSRVSSRGRSGREHRECRSLPGWLAGSEGIRQRLHPRRRLRWW